MTYQADPLKAAGSDVAALASALARGGAALESVPTQVVDVVRTQKWVHFITRSGKDVRPPRFEEFVAEPPLSGLGTNIEMLKKICRDNPEALDAIDEALGSRQGERTDLLHNIQEVKAPTGTSKERALRKLRKDAPDLHAEVLAGNLTSHAAMVKAGYRPRTFTVRADSAESIAATLRRQLDGVTLETVRRLLGEA